MTEKKPPHDPKTLHLLRRPISDHEMEVIARGVAEGRSATSMIKELKIGDDRFRRIRDKVETQKLAIRLRETEIAFKALEALPKLIEIAETQKGLIENLITQMSSATQAINRIAQQHHYQKAKTKLYSDKAKSQREQIKELRAIIRRHGLLP